MLSKNVYTSYLDLNEYFSWHEKRLVQNIEILFNSFSIKNPCESVYGFIFLWRVLVFQIAFMKIIYLKIQMCNIF